MVKKFKELSMNNSFKKQLKKYSESRKLFRKVKQKSLVKCKFQLLDGQQRSF